jgi:hypothetical protein
MVVEPSKIAGLWMVLPQTNGISSPELLPPRHILKR